MRLGETSLVGAYVIEPDPLRDVRGWFARTFDRAELEACGLETGIVQCSLSGNAVRGTLRGLHYQTPPHAEAKFVSCIRGGAYDVAVDLRPESSTYRAWFAVELTAENHRLLYVPPGCAHGFQTLLDDTELLYQITHEYVPAAARGVRWDDPAFAIEWPAVERRTMSERDATYPDYRG